MADHHRDLDQWVTLATTEPLPAWDPHRALPWADLDFSTRILNIHLDPDTPAASRATHEVLRHIDWLEPRPVLDLCCGPGLYCHELARRGCRSAGIDVAPAAIAWARLTSAAGKLGCTFHEADLANPPVDLFGTEIPFAAVTCWFGDLHNFPRELASELLAAATAQLAPGGLMVLEMQPWQDNGAGGRPERQHRAAQHVQRRAPPLGATSALGRGLRNRSPWTLDRRREIRYPAPVQPVSAGLASRPSGGCHVSVKPGGRRVARPHRGPGRRLRIPGPGRPPGGHPRRTMTLRRHDRKPRP